MDLELFNLQNKVALVTGGTHGLGMAMAKGLGKAGAKLVINGHTPAKMEIALAEYKAEGIDANGYLFNVADETEVIQYVSKIEQEVGPIDILVNNAGIIKRVPMEICLSMILTRLSKQTW